MYCLSEFSCTLCLQYRVYNWLTYRGIFSLTLLTEMIGVQASAESFSVCTERLHPAMSSSVLQLVSPTLYTFIIIIHIIRLSTRN